MARERYADQVKLLVEVLPAVAAEKAFALKGGTAINLFYRDLPRLSVDIDLTFLPVTDRAHALAEIDAAMDRLGVAGGKIPGVRAGRIAGDGWGATRVLFQRGAATVKVETSPVMRGVVCEPAIRRTSLAVEDQFGFAEATIVSFEDLFAGKLHAALDRQHPRDLFDVKLLYENEGLTDDLFRVFLIYVASSGRPTHELLSPGLQPLDEVFEKEFAGMTNTPVTVDRLQATRARLIADIRARLTRRAAEFLRSLVRGAPDFAALGLEAAATLPAVRWKVRNIEILRTENPRKYEEQVRALDALLS